MSEPLETLEPSAPKSPDEAMLSLDETYSLLLSMRGMWTGQLKAYGGADGFIRSLKKGDDEDPLCQ